MELFAQRKEAVQALQSQALSEEQQRKNQLELPGVPLFTETQEKARWYSAHKKYVRQRLVNDLMPVFQAMRPNARWGGPIEKYQINDLRQNTKIITEPKPAKPPRSLWGRLWTRAAGSADSNTMGTFFHNRRRLENDVRIEIYPQNIRPPSTAKGTMLHEGIHYFDKDRELYSVERYLSSGFTKGVLDETYAQADEFVSFADPRRSAIIKSAGKFSRTSGWEAEDPLSLVRAFKNYKKNRNLPKTIIYLTDHAKYTLGRAIILELIRKGTVKRPTDIYNVPPEVLKKEMTTIVARSPFIYAGRFARSILSVPAASMERIAAAMHKPAATN
jgi:hypothetical protein